MKGLFQPKILSSNPEYKESFVGNVTPKQSQKQHKHKEEGEGQFFFRKKNESNDIFINFIN